MVNFPSSVCRCEQVGRSVQREKLEVEELFQGINTEMGTSMLVYGIN